MNRFEQPLAVRHGLTRTLLASAAVVLLAWPAYAGSLSDTVRTAVRTNPEVGVVKNDRLAVDQELRQARAGYLPSVDARASAGPETRSNDSTSLRGPGSTDIGQGFRREANITLTQMLFDGFATSSEVSRQSSRVDSASYRVQESAEFIGVDAAEAHLEVLRSDIILKLNDENVAAHERLLRQVRGLERAGRADMADVTQAEARMAAARASREQAIGDAKNARALYIRVVGEKPATLTLEPPPPVSMLPADSDGAADLADVQSPSVLIAAADVDVASAELQGSRAGYYPNLDLQLSADAGQDLNTSDGNTMGASALIVMRYNLFRGGADVAREREAFHRLNEARSNLLLARRKASQDARNSLSAYETAKARTVDLKVRVDAERRTLSAYESQYQLGQRDLLDVLDAVNELFLSRVSLVTADYTERFGIYRVLGVTGRLLDALEIAKPREQINVHRDQRRVQSPTVIGEKSQQLSDPKAEPRILRSPSAGEPPAGSTDAADGINVPARMP